MFQEEVEKGRKEADMELRRRVRSVHPDIVEIELSRSL